MSTTSDDLQIRLGEALHRRADTVESRLSIDGVRAGARRRRARRRGGVAVLCLALVAVTIPFLARSKPQPEPASPTPSTPVLRRYAVLDDPARTPVVMGGQVGGQATGVAAPAVDVWTDGSRTIVVRTQPPASDAALAGAPTTAAEATTVTTMVPSVPGFAEPPPWGAEPVTSVAVRGVTGALQRLADDQFIVWIPGEDDGYAGLIGRGIDADGLLAVAEAATVVGGVLRPAGSFSLAEHHPALPATTAAMPWAYASYGADAATADVFVQTALPLAGRNTLESAGWFDTGRLAEIGGRQVLVTERIDLTQFMWFDPSGVIVSMDVAGTPSAPPAAVALVDAATWNAMGDALSVSVREATTPAARASLDGASIEVRRGSNSAALCVARTCAQQTVVIEAPSHFSFSGVVDGHWRLAGYREVGADEETTLHLDDVHVTAPDGTQLDVVWTRRGDAYWYTVEVPDGVRFVNVDIGMALGGVVGAISRPLAPGTL